LPDQVLQEHRVTFVVIGGFAGRLWGSPSITNDFDLCPAWDAANLERSDVSRSPSAS